ncbi:hypothetical protein B9Z65_329 [Elsinoe australis]|uniref:Nucleoside phosphorylase domain-containing protein n=1 Tax=Elsinoe australis TaxID=40998 RepID=A0A2P7ZQ98_9PEZI|nr:hypothetical protein B9Z65_329 [Elsinoe australis]
MAPERPKRRSDFTIAIICALPLEANAVHNVLDELYDEDFGSAPGDVNSYSTGSIAEYNIVITHLPEMGTISAARAATSLASSFGNIKLAIVAGICGGIPDPAGHERPIHLGDLVVSSGIVQYDFGRQYPGAFETKRAPEDVPGRAGLKIRSNLARLQTDVYRNKFRHDMSNLLLAMRKRTGGRDVFRWSYPGLQKDLLYESTYLHKCHDNDIAQCTVCSSGDGTICNRAIRLTCRQLACDDTRTVIRTPRGDSIPSSEESIHQPDVHIGIVGCANTVMKSSSHRDAVAADCGAIALEMEGVGFWDSFNCIVVKGVCDYADSHKSKDWQSYAAAVGAAGTKALLKQWTYSARSYEPELPLSLRPINQEEILSAPQQSSPDRNPGRIDETDGDVSGESIPTGVLDDLKDDTRATKDMFDLVRMISMMAEDPIPTYAFRKVWLETNCRCPRHGRDPRLSRWHKDKLIDLVADNMEPDNVDSKGFDNIRFDKAARLLTRDLRGVSYNGATIQIRPEALNSVDIQTSLVGSELDNWMAATVFILSFFARPGSFVGHSWISLSREKSHLVRLAEFDVVDSLPSKEDGQLSDRLFELCHLLVLNLIEAELYQSAIHFADRLRTTQHDVWRTSVLQALIAQADFAFGNVRDTVDTMEAAISGCKRRSHPGHIGYLEGQHAVMLLKTGRKTEAVSKLEALVKHVQSTSSSRSDMSKAWGSEIHYVLALARAYIRNRQYREARKVLTMCTEDYHEYRCLLQGGTRTDLEDIMGQPYSKMESDEIRAMINLETGNAALAIPVFRALVEKKSQYLDGESLWLENTNYLLSQAHSKAGNRRESKRLREKAVRAYDKLLLPHHPNRLRAEIQEIKFLLKDSHHREAGKRLAAVVEKANANLQDYHPVRKQAQDLLAKLQKGN